MNEHQSRRVLAGFAILAGIIALTTLVFFLGQIKLALKKHYTVVAIFPTAEGLSLGSPVWIAGHAVGAVRSIGFRPIIADSAPTVAVHLSIPNEYQSLVRRDSHIRMTRPRPVGDPVIDIRPGSASAPPLQDGDTLFGVAPPTVQEVISATGRLRRSLDSLFVESDRLKAFGPRSQQRVARMVASFEIVKEELVTFQQSFAQPGGRNVTDPEIRAALSRLGTTAGQLGPLFADAAQRYQDPALKDAFRALQRRTTAISAQFDSLNSILKNGSLSRFAQDSAIMKAVHAAQVELDSVIAVTKRNPLRYWLGK